MRTVRDLLRRRHIFVRKRAGTMTHFQNSLHQDGCIAPLHNKLQNTCARDALVGLGSTQDMRQMLGVDMAYIRALDEIINGLDKSIREKARQHNPPTSTHCRPFPAAAKVPP